MESDLIKGNISVEEYFCMALTSESTPERAQSSIQVFLKKIQKSHSLIYSALKRVYDEYFLDNYHESFHEDDEDIKLAIEMSLLDVDLRKQPEKPLSCWGVKNPKIYCKPENVPLNGRKESLQYDSHKHDSNNLFHDASFKNDFSACSDYFMSEDTPQTNNLVKKTNSQSKNSVKGEQRKSNKIQVVQFYSGLEGI